MLHSHGHGAEGTQQPLHMMVSRLEEAFHPSCMLSRPGINMEELEGLEFSFHLKKNYNMKLFVTNCLHMKACSRLKDDYLKLMHL